MQKRWGLYAGLAIFIIILSVGTVNIYMGGADNELQLSVRQAVNIFAREGIHLSKTSDPHVEEISGVKPTTFFINDTENKLNIYRYDSISERKTAYEMWRENDGAKSFYSERAKNMLFIIVPVDKKEKTIEDYELADKILKIVFEKVNDTQEIVFTGAGENWESLTVVKYFKYFDKDEDGTLNYENYFRESSWLKYLGKDIESIGDISFEMQRSVGKGSGGGLPVMPDGTVNLGLSGGNGAIPRADEEITFTIRWNDQEETFVASAK